MSSSLLPPNPSYDAKGHLARVEQLHANYELNTQEKCDEWTKRTIEFICGDNLQTLTKLGPLVRPLRACIESLYDLDGIYQPVCPIYKDRDYLTRKEHQLSQERIDSALNTIIPFFKDLLPAFPSLPNTTSGPTVPLYTMVPNFPMVVSAIQTLFIKANYGGHHTFPQLHSSLVHNSLAVSGISPDKPSTRKILTPMEYDGDLVHAFLRHTPFEQFFNAQVPFAIPEDIQFAHTWVVAGSGHGKTTLLTSMIYENIPKVLEGKASIVLIDSQNVIIPQLERLKVWEDTGRLIIIDPAEPVAFSLFDAPHEQLNSALELINFIFAKLADTEMTYRQDNLFNYLSEFLITAVPNATIHDFRNLLDTRKAPKYDKYKQAASSEVQDYLETDFIKEKFTVEARSQVLTKLRAMLRQPAFAEMFGAPKTKLNLFNELERGVCCLIKPDKYKLGEDGTRLFGRFWIAQMKLIAQQRQNTTKKTPTFFYIDECQDYLRGGDPKIETILEQARKENIGLTLLHHYGDQLKSTELVQLLGANTATKMCGSLASSDLTRFASYLDCDPSFITKQEPKRSFACGVRGLTHGAISLRFPYIDLKTKPRMDEAAYKHLRQENIRKYGALQGAETHEGPSKPEPPSANQIDLPAEADPAIISDDDITTAGPGGWKK